MKSTKIFKGEYQVNHKGQLFIVRNMEIHSVDAWAGGSDDKWYVYNDTENFFVGSVKSKKWALNMIERQF